MADPTTDEPVMDEFAQTRGGDDLFDDEIIPVPAEEQAQPEPEVPQPQPDEPAVAEKQPENDVQQPARVDTPPRSRGGDRGRGRGRGGRGRGGRGSHHSGPRRAETGPKNKTAESPAETEVKPAEEPAQDQPKEAEEPGKEDEATSDSKPSAAPNGAEAQRVPAVRGDRSATGGLKKPKLTEEELSQRIAAAKENAAKKAAAHARAEADQASFFEREKVAEEKRRQERANRRVMDNERERNRQRKLDAQTGREWDSVKREEDYNPRGGKSQFRRGMHGGVSGHTRREFEDGHQGEDLSGSIHAPSGHRGRGRGGRGGRGRGNSRGPRGDHSTHEGASDGPAAGGSKPSPSVPVLNNEADFPSLPGGTKKEETTVETAPSASKAGNLDLLSPVSGGGTWADQVESQ